MRFLKLALCLTFSLFATLAHAQSVCEPVSLADVAQRFPAYAPWKLSQGGAAACMFQGVVEHQPGAYMTVILQIDLQFKTSPAEASKYVKTLASTMATPNQLTKSAALGADGFFHQPKSTPGASIGWIAHEGKVISMGLFMVQAAEGLDEEDIQSLTEVIQLALRSGKNKGVAEKAATCRYFDPATVIKLFENPAVNIEEHGENSCLAWTKENKAALIFSRFVTDSPEQVLMGIKDSAGHECTVEAKPELGTAGSMTAACSGGDQGRIRLFFADGNTIVEFNYTSEKKPNAAQRKHLLALGLFARQQLESK
jgi:hypothetical protein